MKKHPPYHIKITTETWEGYLKLEMWCDDNCQDDYAHSYGVRSEVHQHTFKFTDANDVMLFRLTFGGSLVKY
jgi:hypothetical protein